MSWFKFGFGKKKKKDKSAEAEPAAPAALEEAPSPIPEEVDEAAAGENPSTEDVEGAYGAPPARDEVAPQVADLPVDPAATQDAEARLDQPPPEEGGLRPTEPVDPKPAPTPDGPESETSEPETRDAQTSEPEDPQDTEEAGGEAPKGFFARLASGLKKSSSRFSESVSAVFTQRKLDDEALEELEDLLIAADLGAATAAKVTSKLAREKFDKDVDPDEIKQALADVVAETLTPFEAPLDMSGARPQVVLFVGVNGSGKTTTLGKIAVKMTREGGDVITAAGDTFRAAAVEQLEVWSKRAGATFLSRPIGSDAAGLAYDAYEQARREGADAVLIDTAGRLQNKAELMDELRKIVRVLKKQDENAPHHVVLVLDGTVGSNAISQAEAFMEAANVTGVIMTKLDGTAKGGALVQVAEKFGLPIHFIGVGEGEADLQAFDAAAFARALAGVER